MSTTGPGESMKRVELSLAVRLALKSQQCSNIFCHMPLASPRNEVKRKGRESRTSLSCVPHCPVMTNKVCMIIRTIASQRNPDVSLLRSTYTIVIWLDTPSMDIDQLSLLVHEKVFSARIGGFELLVVQGSQASMTGP